jgi:AcrR family transcriptional regulator
VAAGARRRTLSRDRVLAAAVAVADEQGLEAVTMRLVAAELDVEAMSLYHHVAGKDGLLDGLVERVMAEVDTATAALEPAPDWRETVRARCLASRRVMLRHPWAPTLISSRTTVPPAVFAHFEALLAVMVDAGFSYRLGHRALHSLGSMVLGFVQELFSPAGVGADAATDDETAEALARMTEVLPHVTAMVASEVHDNDGDMLGWCDSQEEFEFTLDLLLDGFEAHRLRDVRSREVGTGGQAGSDNEVGTARTVGTA